MNRVFIMLAAIAATSCKGRETAPTVAASVPAVIDAGVATVSIIDAGLASAIAPAGSPRDYKAALHRGRELARHHDWRGAMAAFDAAVRAVPGDARALSELGWAALRAGDLDRAAQASTDAAAIATASPRIRAASLYNLGRVEEAKGDKDAAADAYRSSIALRRSRTVRRHLRALAHGDPVHAHVHVQVHVHEDEDDATTDEPGDGVAGPFAKVDDYCDAIAARDDDGAAVVCLPTSGLAAGADHLDGPPALRIVGMRGELDDVTCLLAFHQPDGWYVWDGVPCETTTAAGTDWAAALALESPASGRVVARFAIGVAARDDAHGHHACEQLAVACRTDTPRPACTPPVEIAWAAACPDAPAAGAAPPAIHWDSVADWSLDGDALVVRAPTPARSAPDGLADLATARTPLR